VQDPHRERRHEPDEGAEQEEAEAEQRDLARGPLVLDAEVALRHRRGVVAKADHHGPAEHVAPPVLERQRQRHRLGRQARDEAGDAAHLRERGEEHHDRERHQDRGLQEVGDDHGPEAPDHAVGQDHHSRPDDRPRQREAAGRRDEEREPVEHRGAGEELEEDRGPGEGLARPLVVAVDEVLHYGADPGPPPARGEQVVAEQERARVADVEQDRHEALAIGETRGAREGPGREAAHERGEPRGQPMDPVSSLEVVRRPAVETHGVEADPQHQQHVGGDDGEVDRADGLHWGWHGSPGGKPGARRR
jgi:hypothetical protein